MIRGIRSGALIMLWLVTAATTLKLVTTSASRMEILGTRLQFSWEILALVVALTFATSLFQFLVFGRVQSIAVEFHLVAVAVTAARVASAGVASAVEPLLIWILLAQLLIAVIAGGLYMYLRTVRSGMIDRWTDLEGEMSEDVRFGVRRVLRGLQDVDLFELRDQERIDEVLRKLGVVRSYPYPVISFVPITVRVGIVTAFGILQPLAALLASLVTASMP